MATVVVPSAARERASISFAGCGFTGMYHVGVGLAIQKHAAGHYKFTYGASAGSIVAIFGACNLPSRLGYKFVRELHDRAHAVNWLGRFGCLHPKFNLIKQVREFLERTLPRDAHRMCRGRVGISLTIVPDMKNWIVTDFNTRAELIQASVCSCFIPLYCGLKFPMFRGKYCCDGGLTSNLPFSNDPMVVTVSPFSGECDICPASETESYYQLYLVEQTVEISVGNIYRGIGALLFLPWNEMEKLFEQGYNDGLNFLKKEGIVPISNEPTTLIDNVTDDTTSDYFSMGTTPNHSRHCSGVSEDILSCIENKEYQLDQFDTRLYRSPRNVQQTHWKRFIDELSRYRPHRVLIAHKLWQLFEILNSRYGSSNFFFHSNSLLGITAV